MSGLIKVIDSNSTEVLFECSQEEVHKAYEFARQMEEMDIDVKIQAPGCAMSLALSLGASEETIQDLNNTLDEEIKSHNLD